MKDSAVFINCVSVILLNSFMSLVLCFQSQLRYSYDLFQAITIDYQCHYIILQLQLIALSKPQ